MAVVRYLFWLFFGHGISMLPADQQARIFSNQFTMKLIPTKMEIHR